MTAEYLLNFDDRACIAERSLRSKSILKYKCMVRLVGTDWLGRLARWQKNAEIAMLV